MLPVLPLVPASAVSIENEPLLDAAARPLITLTLPPVNAVLSPAEITIRPPASVSPLCTVTLMLPDVPLAALIVFTATDPLLPLEPLPDCIDKLPLVPYVPASSVVIVNEPLLVVVDPDCSKTEPPVAVVPSPPENTIRPPFALSPELTEKLTLPLVPSNAEPVDSVTLPLLPTLALPDDI